MLVTNGGKQAIYAAFAAMLDPGDEVIVPAPYWTTYPESIQLAGGVPVEVLADETQDYKVTVEQLEAARTDRTKVLLFVSPSNPTGAVYTADEIRAIGQWVEDHELWVLTDEIYEHLVYDGVETGSLPVLCPFLADNTVVVNGVAKTYAMTGWRVGWMIGPTDLVKAATNLQSHATSNVANVSQRAALAAVSGDLSAVDEMKAAFDRRRKTIVSMLNEIDGVVCPTPHGAFYAYPSVKGLLGKEHGGRVIDSSAELAEYILDEAEVAVVPGEAFGSPGYLRLSYALGDDDLVEGITRLQKLFSVAVGARPPGLPKAHLHLHFTGSMRHATLLELAERDGIPLPDSLVSEWPPELSAADEKGWFRFQRLYDVARSVLRTEDDVRRLVREAAEDDVRDGGRWLEIQVDPSGYGATLRRDHRLHRPGAGRRRLGLARDRARHGGGDRRQPHPAPARRPHPGPAGAQYAGRGVVGFGLSNDERRGSTADFAHAFGIAERAGLALVPHGGELRGRRPHPGRASTTCTPTGSGTASASAEDPALLDRIVAAGVALEVCPVSNVALGVYSDLTSVPLPGAAGRRRDRRARRRRPAAVRLPAGRPVRHDARRARSRPTSQLAELARMSVRASCAPDDVVKARSLAEIDAWLTEPAA